MAQEIIMKKTMITPNVLTISRIILAIIVVYIFFVPSLLMHVLVGILFTIAAVTDYVDGALARKTGQVTTFGKIADPIADKLLILGSYISLYFLDIYSFWWILPIIIREIVVTVLRFVMLSHGKVIAAEKAGKIKMNVQCASLAIAWFYFLVKEHGLDQLVFGYANMLQIAMYVLLVVAVILTVYSGVLFLIKNSDKLSEIGLSRLIGNFFYFGRAPFMPGTVGTLGGIILYYPLRNNPLIHAITIVLVFIVGTWSARKMCVILNNKDPQEVVIDEVVGLLITLFLIPYSYITVICGFFLFRIFDIIKPQPIRRLEKIKNGYGVMLDDVLAGVFANIVLQIIYYSFLRE